MTTDPTTIRRQLAELEARIASMTELIRQAEGVRDTLLQRLQDLEGAHDRRFVPVR